MHSTTGTNPAIARAPLPCESALFLELQELIGICAILAQVPVLARDLRHVVQVECDIEAFAQRLSQFVKSVSKYWLFTNNWRWMSVSTSGSTRE